MTDREAFQRMVDAQPFVPLWNALYQWLSEEIITLRLAPGSRINEAQTAESLGISRSPVKMAIDRLTEDGLLEKAGKQHRVTYLNQKDCTALYEARIAIEGHAAFLASKRISREQLRQLAVHVRAFEALEGAQSPEKMLEFARHDDQFHQIIIDAAGNPYIEEMYRCIRHRLLRYRYYLSLLCWNQNLVDISSVHHKAIYNALKNYSSSAEVEMREDARRMLAAIREISPAASVPGE